MLRLLVIGACTIAYVAAQSGMYAPAPSPQFYQPARQPSPSQFAPAPSQFAPAPRQFAPAPSAGSSGRLVSAPGQMGGTAGAPGQAGFNSAPGLSQSRQTGQGGQGAQGSQGRILGGTTPAPVPNGEWIMKVGCTCFCFNKQNLMDPPAWNATAGAPAKCTRPEPVYPNGDPTAAPQGSSIFTDPVFLGGPALWDHDHCMARPAGDPRQYDIKFFCTCCCPQQQPASQCVRVQG